MSDLIEAPCSKLQGASILKVVFYANRSLRVVASSAAVMKDHMIGLLLYDILDLDLENIVRNDRAVYFNGKKDAHRLALER